MWQRFEREKQAVRDLSSVLDGEWVDDLYGDVTQGRYINRIRKQAHHWLRFHVEMPNRRGISVDREKSLSKWFEDRNRDELNEETERLRARYE